VTYTAAGFQGIALANGPGGRPLLQQAAPGLPRTIQVSVTAAGAAPAPGTPPGEGVFSYTRIP
jgi:hypothetical protein